LKSHKKKINTLALYVTFAILATFVNLYIQWLVFTFITHELVFLLAIIIGTAAGLLVKYILDKKWIFDYRSINFREDTKIFFLYSLMGILTTIVFWGTETIFYIYFKFDGSQYVGAIIGLSFGYYLKYLLDKKYVFTKK